MTKFWLYGAPIAVTCSGIIVAAAAESSTQPIHEISGATQQVIRTQRDSEMHPAIPTSTLYIFFLNMQAAGITRATGSESEDSVPQRARRIHVDPSDLRVIDEVASSFVVCQRKLAYEARNYVHDRLAANLPDDPVVVHSFTTRRERLATHAFIEIRSKVSDAGYQRLQNYLNLEFKNSLHRGR